jgi:hypothetical protein
MVVRLKTQIKKGVYLRQVSARYKGDTCLDAMVLRTGERQNEQHSQIRAELATAAGIYPDGHLHREGLRNRVPYQHVHIVG